MKRSQEKAIHAKERIPIQSTYAQGLNSGQGDLKIEKIAPLMQKLNEAFEIAGEGNDVKHGDTDEADAISGIMGGIQKKYQDKASKQQRSQWH